jgi:hypothetical protein
MKIMPLLSALPLLVMGAPASAVGDMPVNFDQREATEFYNSLRFLLDGDFRCAKGQIPVSGRMTGGDNPMFGANYITILFDKGARLKVDRTWTGQPQKGREVSVKISCS